jgi:membrane protein implicated in regulation of membrane protease activity
MTFQPQECAKHGPIRQSKVPATDRKFSLAIAGVPPHLPRPLAIGVLAQLVERLNGIEEVRGSNPLGSTIRREFPLKSRSPVDVAIVQRRGNLLFMLTTIIALGIAGLLLLFLEMFLPGLIAGIIGAGLLMASVIMAYSNLGSEAGNFALLIAATSSAGLWWWWANHFQKTRFGRAMTLTSSIEGASPMSGLEQLTGQTGEAATPLRPSGTVVIAGKRIDAVTDGEFIEAGSPIRVVRAQGMGIVVRQIATVS